MIKPTSVLSTIISRMNYLSLARSKIKLSICISSHIFIDRYIQQNPRTMRWWDDECFFNTDQKIEPTSVLPEIISRINYLSLAWSRINFLISISPHIFIDRYNKTRQQFDDGSVIKSNRIKIESIEFDLN